MNGDEEAGHPAGVPSSTLEDVLELLRAAWPLVYVAVVGIGVHVFVQRLRRNAVHQLENEERAARRASTSSSPLDNEQEEEEDDGTTWQTPAERPVVFDESARRFRRRETADDELASSLPSGSHHNRRPPPVRIDPNAPLLPAAVEQATPTESDSGHASFSTETDGFLPAIRVVLSEVERMTSALRAVDNEGDGALLTSSSFQTKGN